MSKGKNWQTIWQAHRTLLILLAVGLFLVELEIFALAAVKSGRKSRLQVMDLRGNVIHETDGNHLSDFNKHYFEKTFGPFNQYHVKLVTTEHPFPFRAWFAAAVGIPVGIILLFAFALKSYLALFHPQEVPRDAADEARSRYGGRLEKVLFLMGRFNIFAIGCVVFAAAFAYWVIPNGIAYLGRTGFELLARHKEVVLAAAGSALGLIVWIIYLRYRLAQKAIDSRMEIDKHRLELEYKYGRTTPLQLEYDDGVSNAQSAAGWRGRPSPESRRLES